MNINGNLKPYCHGCKNKPTIHLTGIVNGQVTQFDLCDNCPLLKQFNLVEPFDVQNALAAILNNTVNIQPEEAPDINCKNCGLTFKEFLIKGLLGCSECYNAFKEPLSVILKNIHGSDVHVGKMPLGTHGTKVFPESISESVTQVNRLEKLLNLKEELKEAIQKEEYEYAAQLRDKIDDVEKKEQGSSETDKFVGEGI